MPQITLSLDDATQALVDQAAKANGLSSCCPSTVNVLLTPQKIRVALKAIGTPIGPHDTTIAATALRHQASMITRNAREFSRVPGLQWVNWHQDS